MTRRAASGSRTDEADGPPEPAGPGSGAAGGTRDLPAETAPDPATDGTPGDDPVPTDGPEPAGDEPEPAGDEAGPAPARDEGDKGDKGDDAEPTEAGEPALVGSLRRVRAELAAIRFPLALPDAGSATESARVLATQLDDYLLPRLGRLDAPLLVVVGGSTGAGKSTLVNSLVRAPVSPAGVLRPTTRAPVLVSAPGDARWFLGSAESEAYLLPALTRTTGLDAAPGTLRVITAPGLPRGLALLDAPDLDSVVAANRALADEVHRAADLWLCATTAARYADALPWTALRAARDRGTRLALLLNRVPLGAEEEILNHLGELLDAEGLSGTPLFVLPEVVLDGQGLLAESLVAPLASWLADLAGDPSARVRVVGDTLGGALAALRWSVEELAESADRQHAAATALHGTVRREYAAALAMVEGALEDGTLLRGEALLRWRAFVDRGGLRAVLGGALGQRIRAAFGATDPPTGRLLAALEAGLVTLVVEAVAAADDRVRTAWSADPAGAALLGSSGGTRVAAGEARLDRVRALVRDWLSKVRNDAATESVALLVVLQVLAGDPPLEPREQTRVHGVLGQLAVRTVVESRRTELLDRVRQILDADAAVFTALLADADAAAGTAQRLRAAVSTGASE